MANYEQYYEKSLKELTKYIENNKTIPTEKVWNDMAFESNYLTSQTLGYMAGLKFPELCKKIYKQIQKKKTVGNMSIEK